MGLLVLVFTNTLHGRNNIPVTGINKESLENKNRLLSKDRFQYRYDHTLPAEFIDFKN